jgi:hypothetical protein
MQSEGIDMAGIQFVSLVGIADWVAKNQVANAPTLCLNIVPLLQVAYLLPQRRPTYSTGRREQRKSVSRVFQCSRCWHLDVVQTGDVVGVRRQNDRDHGSVIEVIPMPRFPVWDNQSASSGIR